MVPNAIVQRVRGEMNGTSLGSFSELKGKKFSMKLQSDIKRKMKKNVKWGNFSDNQRMEGYHHLFRFHRGKEEKIRQKVFGKLQDIIGRNDRLFLQQG